MDMKMYEDRPGFSNHRSYGLLTKDEVTELDKTIKEGQILISHVDDGEYTNNIFGNVFSSYTKAVSIYQADLKNRFYQHNDEYIATIILEYWEGKPLQYYVGKIHSGYRNANVWPHLEGLLTIETINGEFQGGH